MMSRMRIILAEDEPRILNFLKQRIPELDGRFEVIAAYLNGKEALAGILHLKPDLVITDIRMPHVNGLDLIKIARQSGSRAEFVVLSGYGDYEYARQAILYKAADYLLKPIDTVQLKSVLGTLCDKIHFERAQSMQETLKTCCAGENMTTEDELISELRIISAFAGSFLRREYGAMSEGTRAWREFSPERTASFTAGEGYELFSFFGYHANEYIFCLIGSSVTRDAVTRLTRAIRSDLSPQSDLSSQSDLAERELHLSFFVTEPISSLRNISLAMQNLYSYLREHLRFGCEGLYFVPDGFTLSKPESLPREIYAMADDLAYRRDESGLECLARIRDGLAREKPPQFELQNYLGYLLAKLAPVNSTQSESLPTAEEIISDAQSYDDIYTSLCAVYQAVSQPSRQDARTDSPLVADVRKYLDENYAKALSYRDLYNVFGYNEKYLATLFKRETGETPAKYVVRLRIENAKRLIYDHPDWMLKQVAQTVGYDDPLYFSKVFREVEAMSPSAYADIVKRR